MDRTADAEAPRTDRPQAGPALWASALTLGERLPGEPLPSAGELPLSTDELPATAGEPLPSAGETDMARKRLADWRALAAFKGDDRHFADRLRATGTTPATLLRLLGEDPAGLAHRIGRPPAWAARFDAAHLARDPSYGHRALPRFLPVVEPVLKHAEHGLRTRLRELESTYGPVPGLADALCDGLPLNQLALALHPTMVLEVNVARVEGTLDGATPQERFASFLRQLSDDTYRARFWREYPVLARHAVDTLERWTEGRARFARHLHQDLPHLGDLLPGRPAVSAVSFGEGDPHQGGQTVCAVEFADGSSLMYKPRSLAVDAHFGTLLARFNATAPLTLRTPRVLDRGDHGWAERVRPAPCASPEEVGDFYRRTGATLALAHALHGVDFHYENLVAVGAHPVLVDLEALFHPETRAGAGGPDPAAPGDPAEDMLRRSVTATGLVPLRIVLDEGTENATVTDPSGISGTAGQLSLVPVSVPVDSGTDQVRMVDRRVPMPAADNQPRLPDGTPPNPAAHLPELLAGFATGYRWLVEHRAELLAPGGLIDRFADAPVRYLARASSVYGKVLMESFHPDFLRDALDRERSVARMCSGWRGVPGRERVIRAEMDSLLAGDIPVFHLTPGSRDLRLEGGTRLPGFLAERPLDAVRRRIEALGPADLARQDWIIRGSFAGLADLPASGAGDSGLPASAAGDDGTPRLSPPVRATRRPAAPAPDDLVAEAVRIGDRLLTLAATGGKNRVGWLAPRTAAAGVGPLASVGTDLYSGLSGIGLFLDRLAAVSGERRFAALAERVADEVVRRVTASAAAEPPAGGAFGPALGPLYHLAHSTALGGDRARLDAVLDAVLPAVADGIAQDTAYDVLGGSAGAVLTLLAVHATDGDPRLPHLARRAADHLLAGAVPHGAGTGWPNPAVAAARPLTGFAHGASGAAVALARLHAVTPDERYVRTAVSAVAYETGGYVPEERCWPDFREDAPGRYRAAWCHGSAGIGMARTELLRLLGDGPLDEEFRETLRRDVRAALPPTADQPGVRAPRFTGRGNHGLCHGDLGNLELPLLAGREGIGDPAALATALAGVLDEAASAGWICGSPDRTEVPGLLTGLSGIGYQLLRLARPEDVPSVLLLHGAG